VNKLAISDYAPSCSASQRQGSAGQGILLFLHINTNLVYWFSVGPLLLAGQKKILTWAQTHFRRPWA